MTGTLTAADLPDSVLGYQYSRCALYLSHIEFYRSRVAPRLAEGLHVIEFGGSNGFIRDLFAGVSYEIAPNAPEVDIQNLSAYPADAYDFVVLDEILEHVPRPWVAVEEVRRILKPGGTLITSSPFMIAVHKVPEDYWRFTKEAMSILLEKYTAVETHSWGNPASVAYLMNGMMVTTQEAIDAGSFDLADVEKFAIDVWAYATK
ncbi:class I SAM-dependent methyltransferase [Microbacterium aurum]